jgi:hypothetical protein
LDCSGIHRSFGVHIRLVELLRIEMNYANLYH